MFENQQMEITIARQLLKSLCENSYWKYAAFWKLHHGSPSILTWDDAYINPLVPIESTEGLAENIYSNIIGDLLFSQSGTSTYDDNFPEYPIELVLSEMTHLQYAWGEGVVGEVACSGNHSWLTLEDVFMHAAAGYTCPEKWLLQFAAGIKTILLVPFLPHGVLQLGSSNQVTEDLTLVDNLRTRFSVLKSHHDDILPFILKGDIEQWSAYPSTSCHINNSNAQWNVPIILPNWENSSLCQVAPLLAIEDLLQPSGDDPYILQGQFNHEIHSELVSFNEKQMAQNGLLEFSCLGEEQRNYELDDYMAQNLNAYQVGDLDCKEEYAHLSGYHGMHIMNNISSFPRDCELYTPFGSSFEGENNSLNSSVSLEDLCVKPSAVLSWFSSKNNEELLVKGMVANSVSVSDYTDTGSFQIEKTSQAGSIAGFDADSPPRCLITAATGGDDASGTALSSTSDKNMMNTVTIEQSNVEFNKVQSKKGRKTSNLRKRQASVVDSDRPRPKDRQMIQDRVKQLRGLVPISSGAKCSIDGLLDRTIKHMLFLRNVIEHADKLKQWVHQEVNSRISLRSHETLETGSSWAVEFGSDVLKCPIIVEDLPYSGHIIIEVICEEHGFFLEIAQVICDLQLTILNGMEYHKSNNTWAQFIVEASKGFNRMDIFWPLMHLLQRKRSVYIKQEK